jgi:drug/metabolite transporter (DMT)-like permease
MNTRLSAPLKLLAAALLFSTGGAAIKATALTGWQVASFRSGFAALAIWTLVPAARRGYSWRAVPVGAAYAATLVLYVLANKLTTAASTIFLQSTAPLYLLLLSPWLLREPIRRQDLWFMAAVGLGLSVFFIGVDAPTTTAPDPWRGNLFAAASGACWALTMVGLRWMSRLPGGSPHENPALPAVVLGNLFACAAGLPFALPLHHIAPVDGAVVVYLGIFQIGLAYVLLTSGLRHVPVFEASIILLVEPVLNPVWAWLVHRERPGAWLLAGGAVILGAATVRTWFDARDSAPASPLPADTMTTAIDR